MKKQNLNALLLWAGGLLLCLILGTLCGINTTLLMSRIVIMALFALSLNIQTGFAGLGNLGHALYFGLGSYGVLIFVSKFGFPLYLAAIASIVLLTVASTAVGFPMLQSDDKMSFLFLSFGTCLLIYTAFAKWAWVGNKTGLTYSVRPAVLNAPENCFLLILDETAAYLSYGDQRRLEIAITLALDPKILLLDEPTAGVARAESYSIMDMVRQLNQKEGYTILFIEHDMNIVFNYSDIISVMDHGQLVASDTPSRIKENEFVKQAYLGGAT